LERVRVVSVTCEEIEDEGNKGNMEQLAENSPYILEEIGILEDWDAAVLYNTSVRFGLFCGLFS
jgi:hypothetical protein